MFGVTKYNTSLYSIFYLVYIHNLMEYCCTLFIVLMLCNYRKSDALGHLECPPLEFEENEEL